MSNFRNKLYNVFKDENKSVINRIKNIYNYKLNSTYTNNFLFHNMIGVELFTIHIRLQLILLPPSLLYPRQLNYLIMTNTIIMLNDIHHFEIKENK
jgi:hypothetical protein